MLPVKKPDRPKDSPRASICSPAAPREKARRDGAERQRLDAAFRLCDRFVERRYHAIELQFVERAKNFAHSWAWVDAEIDQVTSEQYRRRRLMLDPERLGAIEEPLDS